jgi:hypothetical protein
MVALSILPRRNATPIHQRRTRVRDVWTVTTRDQGQFGQDVSAFTEYLCPFCISTTHCTGPHIEEHDLDNFEQHSLNQYVNGYSRFLSDAIKALQNLQKDAM